MRITIAIAVLAAAVAGRGAAARAEPRHEIFVEALGKGGLWGLGYAYRVQPRVALGAVASFSIIDGQRITTATPYVQVEPAVRGRHAWYVDAGVQLVHLATPSPVPEWTGTSDAGIGAEVSTGYQYRGRLLVRVFAMTVIGAHGIAPWLGVGVGWAL